MRALSAVLLGLACGAAGLSQGNGEGKYVKRYGVEPEPLRYPQKTPQEALQSVLKTLDNGRIYYLTAHLADPKYVDERVREHVKALGNKGTPEARAIVAFEKVVQEIGKHFRDDPSLIRQLQKFGREGEWEVKDDRAAVKLKSGARRAFFRKADNRWFLENKQE
jgi:hypothetical protein